MIKTSASVHSQYESLKAFLRHLRAQAVRHRDQTRDIKTTVDELLTLLKEADSRLSVVPVAVADYAKAQENDPAYDLVGEVAALRSAVSASIAWIVANVPVDPLTGTVNERLLNADGTTTLAFVDAAKAAEAVAQIQTVIDLIE